MSDIKRVPTSELRNDYYASKMDAETIERLTVTVPNPELEERAETNRKIMAVIEQEMKRRGESL